MNSDSECSACELCDSSDSESECADVDCESECTDIDWFDRDVSGLHRKRDEQAKTSAKFAFTSASCKLPVPHRFDSTALDADVVAAIQWIATTDPNAIMAERENATAWVESIGHAFVESGATEQWFSDADPEIRAVTRGVNGPLAEWLAEW